MNISDTKTPYNALLNENQSIQFFDEVIGGNFAPFRTLALRAILYAVWVLEKFNKRRFRTSIHKTLRAVNAFIRRLAIVFMSSIGIFFSMSATTSSAIFLAATILTFLCLVVLIIMAIHLDEAEDKLTVLYRICMFRLTAGRLSKKARVEVGRAYLTSIIFKSELGRDCKRTSQLQVTRLQELATPFA